MNSSKKKKKIVPSRAEASHMLFHKFHLLPMDHNRPIIEKGSKTPHLKYMGFLLLSSKGNFIGISSYALKSDGQFFYRVYLGFAH